MPPAGSLLETGLREAVRNELRNQLDPLRQDIAALAQTYSAVAALTPALQFLASVPALLGTGGPGARPAALPGARRTPGRQVRQAALRAGPAGSDRGCAIIGCDRPFRSRGYCSAHYQQRRMLQASGRLPAAWRDDAPPQSLQPVSLPRGGARRAGGEKPKAAESSGTRACAVIGCSRPHRSRGYCSAHYQRRRLLEASGRLPADWKEDAAPHSVADVVLPRGRRPRGEVPAAATIERKASASPRVWVRKRGESAKPLPPPAAPQQAAEATQVS